MAPLIDADEAVVVWLNGLANDVPPLGNAVELLVGDHFIPTFISLLMLASWFIERDPTRRERTQKAVLAAMAGMGFASFVVLMLNIPFFRDRPFVDHELTLLFYQPTDSSFPAHPAAVGFSMATAVWQGHRKAGAVMYVLAAVWGLSRVTSGVFYPTDIVVGGLIGVVMGYLTWRWFMLIEPLPSLVIRAARRFHLA